MLIKQLIDQSAAAAKEHSEMFFHGRYTKFIMLSTIAAIGPGTLLQVGILKVPQMVDSLRG